MELLKLSIYYLIEHKIKKRWMCTKWSKALSLLSFYPSMIHSTHGLFQHFSSVRGGGGPFFFLSLLLIDSKSLIMKLPYYTTVQHMTWILTIGKGKSPWTDALNKTDCAFFSAFIFAERLSVLSFWQIFIFLFNCWLLLRSIFFICRSALKIRLKLMWWIGRSFLLDSLMAILLQVCKKTGKSWCDQSIFMFF